MRLWSIQPLELYERLKIEKVLHCDIALSAWKDDEQFMAAYDWLAEQMRARVGEPPEGVRYPFWAWHTLDWQHKKPDLRKAEFRSESEPSVCIELEIPDSEVLLSDEDGWHFAITDWYLGDAVNEVDSDKEDDWFNSLPKDEQVRVKRKSREKILDVTPLDSDWHRRGCYIQATFWEMRLSDVIEVRHFRWPPRKEGRL